MAALVQYLSQYRQRNFTLITSLYFILVISISTSVSALDRYDCEWLHPPDPAWLDQPHDTCRALCILAVKSSLACAEVPKCGDHCRDAKSCTSAGNPIELLSGTKTHTETDYRSGGQYPLVVTRNYSSSNRFIFDNFGQQWTGFGTQYIHAQFFAASQERMTVVRPNGDKVRYWLNTSGGFDPISRGTKAVLNIFDFNGQAIFQYITSSGIEEVYKVDLDEYNTTGETKAYLWWTTSREGIKHRYNIDATGRLLSVSDDFGRQLTYSYYDSGINAGKIAVIQLPGNRELNYQYDALGNLTFVVYPDNTPGNLTDNPRKQYHYEDTHIDVDDFDQDGDTTERLYPHHLTGITDERGNRYATYAYNDQGWAILSEHAGGAERMEVIDYSTETTRIRNAANKETTFTFTAIGSGENIVKRVTQIEGHPSPLCSGDLSTITYDTNGFKDREVDRNGNITDYGFDNNGFETQRIEAQGTPVERTVVSVWDKNRYKPTSIEILGHKRTNYSYDDKGRIDLVTEIDLLTAGNPSRTWDYNYTFHFFDFNNDGVDDETNVATITIDGPRTEVIDQTIQSFNPAGLLIQVSNALGHTVLFQDHSSEGLPQTMVDSNNVTTELRYTLRGWLDTRTIKSVEGDAITNYDYFDNGLVSRITLPNGVALHYDYDAAQRLTRITNSNGEYIEYNLNALGNRETETIHSETGTIVRQQQHVFDELGRLKQNLGINNQILEEFDYDGNGNIVSIADNNLATIIRTFDGLNRLARETNREAGVTQYTYDNLDQLNTVTDANGLVTDYDYNGFGFLTKLTSPDTSVTNYTSYDLAGNLTAKTDARGVVTQYTYDALSRLVNVIFPANPEENYSFTYDDESNGNQGIGRRTGLTQANGNSITWKYDSRGNVIENTRTIGNDINTTRYRYDLADNLVQMTYPNGRIINYQRDDQTAEVFAITTQKNSTAPVETLVSAIDYQPFGPINRMTFANGLTQTKTYDLHYRPDTIVTNDGGTVQLQNLDYDFDPVGTLNPIIDNLSASNSQTFSYDNQYRLTSATGNYGNFQYDYDATGNRTGRTLTDSANNFVETLNYSNPLTSNQLQGIDGGDNPRTFAYTDNGNLASDSTGRELIYNHNNRLIEVKDNGITIATYGYNALGQRDSKTTLNGTGHFIYGSDGKLLFETIPGSTTLMFRTYVYLNGMPVAMLEDVTPTQAASLIPAGPVGVLVLLIVTVLLYRYRNRLLDNQIVLRGLIVPLLALTGLACGGGDGGSSGGDANTNTYFYVNDHLGTPQLLTNSNKQVVWQGEYTPFGEVEEVVKQVEQPLRFPGQYHDMESGLYYNVARDYDPGLGRYIQSDPLGLVDGPNTYAYVGGNPLVNVDPSGEFFFAWFLYAGGGAAAVSAEALLIDLMLWIMLSQAAYNSDISDILDDLLGPLDPPDDVVEEDFSDHNTTCVLLYVQCIDQGWIGPCGICLQHCTGPNKEWPFWMCRKGCE